MGTHAVLLDRLMTLHNGGRIEPSPALLKGGSPNMRAMAAGGEYLRAVRYGSRSERVFARALLTGQFAEERRYGHQTFAGRSEQLVVDPHAGMWLAARATALLAAIEDGFSSLERDASDWLEDHLGLLAAGASPAPRYDVALPGARLPNDGDDDDGDGAVDPDRPVRFVESLALRLVHGDPKAWQPQWQRQRYFLGLRVLRVLLAEGRCPEPREDWQAVKLACPLSIERTATGHRASMTVPPGVSIIATGSSDGRELPCLEVELDWRTGAQAWRADGMRPLDKGQAIGVEVTVPHDPAAGRKSP